MCPTRALFKLHDFAKKMHLLSSTTKLENDAQDFNGSLQPIDMMIAMRNPDGFSDLS